MAAGDGVSLPTTLAQMGSVAKAQAKGQQHSAQTTAFADQLNKDDELKAQHIREADKAGQKKQQIDEKGKNSDKRKRRRLKRSRKELDPDAENAASQLTAEETETSPEEEEAEEQLGLMIDLRV